MYSTAAIANEFLELGEKDNIPLSPMKLQKLVYYAHGWSLAIFDKPLVNEQVECWKYGPVFRSLFRLAKRFGADPIQGRIESSGKTARVSDDSSGEVQTLIRTVWDNYKRYSAVKLSNMTHMPDTPWSRVQREWQQRGLDVPLHTDIPAEWIKGYFQNLTKIDDGAITV